MFKYYTVLTREPVSQGALVTSPWCVHFGSYDREDCITEKRFLTIPSWGGTFRKADVMIICTDPAQSAIDAKIADLNNTHTQN